MKLLFDHHLSPTLVTRLIDLFPGSEHVWNLALHDLPDTAIWLYAREHQFTVVSKDADFAEISMDLGFPPKLVWLRIANWKTSEIETLIRARYTQIQDLSGSPERAILVLFKSSAG